jgi:hypothetical protein
VKLTHGKHGEPRIDLSDEDPEALMDDLRALVYANPEFVYQQPETQPGLRGCVYAFNGAPSCLIGQWLHVAGVPVEELKALDELPGLEIWFDEDDPESPRLSDSSVQDLIEFEIITLPEGLSPEVLIHAQVRQDQGEPWGAVL